MSFCDENCLGSSSMISTFVPLIGLLNPGHFYTNLIIINITRRIKHLLCISHFFWSTLESRILKVWTNLVKNYLSIWYHMIINSNFLHSHFFSFSSFFVKAISASAILTSFFTRVIFYCLMLQGEDLIMQQALSLLFALYHPWDC